MCVCQISQHKLFNWALIIIDAIDSKSLATLTQHQRNDSHDSLSYLIDKMLRQGRASQGGGWTKWRHTLHRFIKVFAQLARPAKPKTSATIIVPLNIPICIIVHLIRHSRQGNDQTLVVTINAINNIPFCMLPDSKGITQTAWHRFH